MSHKNEQFVLAQHASDAQSIKDTWKLQEAPYPQIKADGEFIWEALFMSVDPYMSSAIKQNSTLGGKASDVGAVQKGHVAAKVLESKNKDYPVGTVFVTILPWARYGLSNGKFEHYVKIMKKPGEPENFFDRLGYNSAIGALGMPSQTAYYGIIKVGKITKDDIVLVSGAAGAVGSVAGQIAKKILGAKKVIGVAGGKQKCELITKELGFDAAIDYKEYNTKEKVAARLKEILGDEKITAYFDNTGGFVTDAVFDEIARKGRIIVCGQISQYHASKHYEVPNYLAKTVYAALSILGFVVFDWQEQNEEEFFAKFPKWVEEGKIIAKETLVEGFKKLPEAYEMLYTGGNVGKIVVKV